MSTKPPTTKKE
jgi:hypothetical protein